jgi:hypothetical protein
MEDDEDWGGVNLRFLRSRSWRFFGVDFFVKKAPLKAERRRRATSAQLQGSSRRRAEPGLGAPRVNPANL